MATSQDLSRVYTVSQLNEQSRLILEETLQVVWVSGEISNLAQPSSGHVYFSLKDENAQVRCAFFKNSHRRLRFKLENGQQILVQAQVSLYVSRGEFQLIVQDIELAGDGLLQITFEQLKKRLAAEGLFDEAHKKALPEFPHTIGVITSSTGAAIRDILTVLKRRFASIPIIIYPTMVQGDSATLQIVDAINTANARKECEVLILARGGGSLEDLWCFNHEAVARAIFHCEIPLVTGIGHEIDFTIADFVADLRAPTPSAAAECVTPDKLEYQDRLENLQDHLTKTIHIHIKQQLIHLHHLQKRLRHPGQLIQEQMQFLDQTEVTLKRAIRRIMEKKQDLLKYLTSHLFRKNPAHQIDLLSEQLVMQQQRLQRSWKNFSALRLQKIDNLARQLQTVSPQHTLERGYAIISNPRTHQIIRDAKDTAVGEKVIARLAAGQLECSIDDIIPN